MFSSSLAQMDKGFFFYSLHQKPDGKEISRFAFSAFKVIYSKFHVKANKALYVSVKSAGQACHCLQVLEC